MEKLDIRYMVYDQEYYFVTIRKNNESIELKLELVEFSSEMNHWDIPTKIVEKDGEVGFAISNKVSRERINLEVERIVNQYSL